MRLYAFLFSYISLILGLAGLQSGCCESISMENLE